MKKLLTITAAIEAGTGIGLLVVPSVAAPVSLGAMLDASAAVAVARVAGAALHRSLAGDWPAHRSGGLVRRRPNEPL